MKKIIAGVIVIILIIIGVSYFGKNSKQSAVKEPIKIGVIFPMTGNNAAYSEKFIKGLNLAKDEINASGGVNGKNIELIIEDGMADPAKSISGYQKLKQENLDMSAVISAFSSVVLAISPLANNDHIVLMNPVASAANLAQAGDYEFNVMPLMNLSVNKMAEYVNSQKITQVAIIYVNTDFGKSGHSIFKSKFESLGGKIIAEESYQDGDTDMRTQLSKIKQTNPQAIYLITTGKSGGVIIKQIGELKIKSKLFSTDAIETPETLSLGGSATENLIYTSPALDANSTDPGVKDFVTAFQNKYNALPEIYGANNYDTLKLLALAIKNGGNNGNAIKNYLYSIKNYDGAAGNLSFDSDGNVIKPIILKIIKGGQFIKYSD